jgi:hypothetical protein
MPLPPNTLAELQRDMARLGCVVSQIREIEQARQKRLEEQPETGPHAMVLLLARIVGVGVETADMLVHEVLSRPMRDRRAEARGAYVGSRKRGLADGSRVEDGLGIVWVESGSDPVDSKVADNECEWTRIDTTPSTASVLPVGATNAPMMSLNLDQLSLTNVDEAAGRWQFEGGQVRRNGEHIFGSGGEIGSVSAVSTAFASYIGRQFTRQDTLLTIRGGA